MSPVDSNLLLAVIALQMDFIDRETLVDALQSWLLDRSQTMGEILVATGKLSMERRGLLEALVAEHLKQHDDDPQRSFLATLQGDSSIREVLSGVEDPNIHTLLTEVAALGTPPDQHATEAGDAVAPNVWPTESDPGPRFRILRPHAQGGLGQVSVALDKELHREVALKELQMQFAGSGANRERFMLEAEITGGLEHPGVVPVYGLGHHRDGRPFYAMRFVRGDNLQEAISRFHKTQYSDGERALELRKLLQRFIDVCDAIQYAHSRGVLHRDLKPGNIMLGKHGETLVVDWGLAKAMDQDDADVSATDTTPIRPASGSGSAPTNIGSVIGTPAYMSPEQAAGRLDLLGPASDIYGLGATLYHLLAGKPPFTQRSSDLLKKVEHGEFPAPRDVNNSVSPALEAVCLTAMQVDRDDRYESARALADDIEHWLADQPVSAYRDPLLARVGRWVRRRWTLLISTAAAAMMGLMVLSVSLVLLKAAHRREQASFAHARQSVDEYFTLVSEDTLLQQPGLQPLRRELLERALLHYQTFVADRAGESSLQDEVGVGHYRIALVKEALASLPQAMASLDAASRIQTRLADLRPSNDRLHALGNTINAMGRIHVELGQLTEAHAAFLKAANIRSRLTNQALGNAEYVRRFANTNMNLGEVCRAQGNLAEARTQFESAQELRRLALKSDPGNQLVERDIGKGSYNLGNLLADIDEQELAETHFSAAVESFDRLRAAGGMDLEVEELVAASHRRLGDLAVQADRLDEAGELYARARAAIAPLAFNNPGVRQYQATHALILTNVGDLYFRRGEFNDAADATQAAMTLFGELSEKYPAHPAYPADHAAAATNLGHIYLELEELADATTAIETALATIRPLADGESDSAHQRTLAAALWASARVRWGNGDFDDAIERLEEARTIPQQYSEDTLDVLIELHALYSFVATDPESAPADIATRLAALDSQITTDWPETEIKRESAGRLRVAGRLQWAAGQLDAAATTLRHAVEIWTSITDEPKVGDEVRPVDMARGDLAGLNIEIANEHRSDGNRAAARKSLEAARDILVPLLERYPSDQYYQRDHQSIEATLRELSADEGN